MPMSMNYHLMQNSGIVSTGKTGECNFSGPTAAGASFPLVDLLTSATDYTCVLMANPVVPISTIQPHGRLVYIPSNTVSDTWTLSGSPTGGTFTLSYDGHTTSALANTATAAQVQTAMQGLSTIGAGNMTCTGGPFNSTSIVMKFAGTLANTSIPYPVVFTSSLTGGTPIITHTTYGSTTMAETPWPGAVSISASYNYYDGTQWVHTALTFNGGSTSATVLPGADIPFDNVTLKDHNGNPYTLSNVAIPAFTGTAAKFPMLCVRFAPVAGYNFVYVSRLSQQNSSLTPFNGLEWTQYNNSFDASNPANSDSTHPVNKPTGTGISSGGWYPDWITGTTTSTSWGCTATFGDSIGAGNDEIVSGLFQPAGWPNRLAQSLTFAGMNMCKHAIAALNFYNMGSNSYYLKTVGSHFNYATIELCTNDIAAGVTLATFKTYMYGIVSTINAGNSRTRVICVGPAPRSQWLSGNATLANQTAQSTTSWNALEAWYVSGGTLVSDCAANGATVYSAVDVTEVATTFGPSGSPSSLVLGYNLTGNYIWNSNAQVLWTGTLTTVSTVYLTDTSMSGDMTDLRGAYIIMTSGAANGLQETIADMDAANKMRLLTAFGTTPSVGDTYEVIYNPCDEVGAGGGIHPSTNGHQYITRLLLATGLYTAFNGSPNNGGGFFGLM